MKKVAFAIAVLVFIAACLPLTPVPSPSPVVDTAATAQANLQTAIVQTLMAQPTSTSAPSDTLAAPTFTLEVTPSPTETATAAVELTSTMPTGTFEVVTSTDLPATLPVAPGTATLTPGVLTYGTLPPAVPFSHVTLINRARTQAYISLQVVTAEGGPAILEYQVHGRIKIDAPIGHYLYVAWVGGRKMVGEFRLHQDEDLEILLYRDKVVVR
ncbi:MAG TPA: hypothetical protein VJ785_17575 [Anaerolineales bacterium]|nr:hypothetical protein [Anaerolineales bacterium]